MKIGYTTDNHWEFVPNDTEKRISQECDYINSTYDMIINLGDICPFPKLLSCLAWYNKYLNVPMVVLLGNHDYYGAHFVPLEKEIQLACNTIWPRLIYGEGLSGTYENVNGKNVFMMYINGFGDGIGVNGPSLVTDEKCILSLQSKPAFMQNELRRAAAKLSVDVFNRQIENWTGGDIYIFTHVPPFKEACLYLGQPSEPEYLPYFVNRFLGDRIMWFALQHPEVNIKVYCGHTHDQTTYKDGNITCIVGKGEYGLQFIDDVE